MPPRELARAYAICRAHARHAENFPVGSLLVPRRLRPHVYAVYAFARVADDIADEGADSPARRLARLDAWEAELDAADCGAPTRPEFAALADTMRRFDLPARPFRDLLSAFRQDVRVTRYTTFEELRDYCRRSADPVGRIVLALFGCVTDRTVPLSDAVCTALQLTNFWQDVAIDARHGRIYLPRDDRERFGVDERTILESRITPAFRALMRFELDRTEELFRRGAALPALLPGRLAREVAATIDGGRTILARIRAAEFDVFAKRPSLTTRDHARLLVRALVGARPAA